MFSAEDVEWLKQEYSTLHASGNYITGLLPFRMSYHRKTGNFTLNAPASDALLPDVIYHTDSYEISVMWPSGAASPLCTETGARLSAVLRKKGLERWDIHVNPGGDFCLAAPQQLDMEFEKGFSLRIYIEKYVIPFLFQQTHYDKTNEWAWPPASHGIGGILEWYHRHPNEPDVQTAKHSTLESIYKYKDNNDTKYVLKRLRKGLYKGHMRCFCSLDIRVKLHRIRDCSPDAMCALNYLRKDILDILIKNLPPEKPALSAKK